MIFYHYKVFWDNIKHFLKIESFTLKSQFWTFSSWNSFEKLQNEANTRPFQKLTCLSVFKLLTRYLSSEHSKHIQKNLWLRIFHSLHKMFEKIIFAPQYSRKWAFCKQILTKITFGASKNLKKIIFFRFSKNDHRFNIWSLWVP